MSVEENKAVVVRVHESINRHDLDALNAHPGMAETKVFLEGRFRAVPDMQATIDLLVAEGEWVAARLLIRGTQQGEWMGQAPTGGTLLVEVLTLFRVVDGRIVTAYSQGSPIAVAAAA
jgi:predicted ester cyclase